MKKMALGTKILIALLLGSIVGVVMGESSIFFKPFGDLFIKLVKMLVVPLVFVSITNGMIGIGDIQRFGKLGIKTFAYFITTTAFAVVVGLIVAQIIQPGMGFSLNIDTSSYIPPTPVSPKDMLLGLVPDNGFGAMAEGKVLQVIVFSIFLGTAILFSGEKGKPVAIFFESLNEIMFKFVNIIIQTAPYGVFCLMAPTTGLYGVDVLMPLIKVILALAIAVLFQFLICYIPILKFVGRYSIKEFFKNAAEPLLVAFTTALSSAAFPFSLKAQTKMKVSKKVRNFVIPLGMTINMDGTSLYLAISATFIANVYGIPLTPDKLALIVFSGILGSIGATATPMAGLMMLTLVLTAAGLPLEGLALVAGIDRILDMFRTVTNVGGDNVGSIVVAMSENEVGKEEDFMMTKEHVINAGI